MNTLLPLLVMLLAKADLGTGQVLVGCIPGCYLDNKVCKPCPDQCETCISDNNCTTCKMNSYGQTCQLKCDVICKGVCHKTYGHCTFSCRDGHYPVPHSPECFECPTNCRLCNSSSNCFSCQPGFYGPICEDDCQQDCTSSCHKDYGHCTYGCEDGTYHAENDICLHCQPDCELCRSKNGCLRRRAKRFVESYKGHNEGAGQELMICIAKHYLNHGNCTPCPDQCETCISDNNCTTCERNYYGQTCQLTCDVRCEGLCHKTYGYCTFSCRDGHYPVQDSPECYECPTNCRLCNSSSNCFSCQPGFYGQICEDVCQEDCTSSCHKNYGHCTYGCEDGTYHAENDTCLHCKPSCEVCMSQNDCLRRKSRISVTETTRHDHRNSTEDLDWRVTTIAIVTASILVFCITIVASIIYRRKRGGAKSTQAGVDEEKAIAERLFIPINSSKEIIECK